MHSSSFFRKNYSLYYGKGDWSLLEQNGIKVVHFHNRKRRGFEDRKAFLFFAFFAGDIIGGITSEE
jgi:hypothetical protein